MFSLHEINKHHATSCCLISPFLYTSIMGTRESGRSGMHLFPTMEMNFVRGYRCASVRICWKAWDLQRLLRYWLEFSNHIPWRRVLANNELGQLCVANVVRIKPEPKENTTYAEFRVKDTLAHVNRTFHLLSRLPDYLSEVRRDRFIGIVRCWNKKINHPMQ